MSDRKDEIGFVLGMIDKFCTEYQIALIPCETKQGVKYVGVLDNTNGNKYAMIKQK
ncbi:hypothetical protein [Clostridium brassicae]|uniref:Uncharacterized protein n=1 Tax=Clostridium brassicae TaxID=2999072 RepID=A0ABT4D6K7_9CLOT|nr:hypothetical protein [Clostridium brassicae]MCY6957930.1 hypothetical protein [Clostridium brassicae]